jgi:hypothetical protein
MAANADTAETFIDAARVAPVGRHQIADLVIRLHLLGADIGGLGPPWSLRETLLELDDARFQFLD